VTLTRFVRIQLTIFAILTVVGLAVMGGTYVGVPALLGIGRYEVTVELAATGGLYQNANVAYRGTNVGVVREVRLTPPTPRRWSAASRRSANSTSTWFRRRIPAAPTSTTAA
jgi:ABC-type transporter Mla subunit MlaD